MTVYKRGEIFHVRAQVGGIKIARTTKSSNRRVAEQLEKKWVSEVFDEVIVAGRRPITVAKAVEMFLASRRGLKGQANAEVRLRPFVKNFGSRFLHDVEAGEVREMCMSLVEDDNYAINTINVGIVYWNAIQNFCAAEKFTPGSKAKRLKGGKNRIRFLSKEEINKLLYELHPDRKHFRVKAMAQDNYDFTIALLNTGAREQEIAQLSLGQIDLDKNTITIHRSKGGTDSTLIMSKALREVVDRRIAAATTPQKLDKPFGRVADGLLFPVKAQSKCNKEWIKVAAMRAGLKDISAHTMRHTAATMWLQAGLSLPEVGNLLGHRNLQSTMVYAHFSAPAAAARAVQVLDSIGT
jgi:integrase